MRIAVLDSDERRWVAARVGALLLLALVLVGALRASLPPPPKGLMAPALEFSAERAREHLKVVGATPHAAGMPRHADVRDYLQRQLEALGAEAQVQRQAIFAPERGVPRPAATVENVVGRLRGSSPGAAVLLVAHYDSVPTGPGAADNAAAVASLLEVGRALRAGPRLVHDVVLLFTDAEEIGLLGSRAFAEAHPWASDIKVVLNVDSRGSEGPVLMFETSPDNGWLIRQLGEAAPRVHACSLYAEVYQRMPNDTDFSSFRGRGFHGLNFANLEGSVRYHTRLETVDDVNLGTIQHQGDTLLPLTRRLGDSDLAPAGEGNRIYINAGPLLLHYAQRWARPLLAVAAGLLSLVIALGVRRGALRPAYVAREAGALLSAVLGAFALVSLGWPALKALKPDYRAFLEAESYDNGRYVTAFAAAALAVVLGVLALRRRARPSEVAAAGSLLWAVPCAFTSLFVPGASCLFLWPLLCATAALALLCWSPERPSPWAVLLLGLTAVPSVLLLSPIIHDFFFALQLDKAGVAAALMALSLSLLAPCFQLALGRALPAAAVGTAAVALGLLGSGAMTQRFDARHPRPSSLMYLLDADTATARWVSSDAQPDPWLRALLGDAPPVASLPALPDWMWTPLREAPAPPISVPAAEVSVEEDRSEGGTRSLRLRLASRRAASFVDMQILPLQPLRAVRLAGRRVEGPELERLRTRNGVLLRYWAPPPEGFELGLELEAGVALHLRVSDHTYALPAEVMASLPARPSEIMPAPFIEALGEGTRVTRQVELGAGPAAPAVPP